MTINNSGYVMKYDGQPMPANPISQNGESLDDLLAPKNDLQPQRDYSPRTNYTNQPTAIVPAPNYAIQKK
jgi:hypothetical protein